ncbi:PREDICTED: hippocampus abundant transcript 1 protein-like isoform X6 [Trachymyrmex septentrionalis]|uniref:hippocampus abundant transcript 1 protein isoform X6 n=1 Tax=Mycetomoellerius zeteki TaxID=64791 RepID=UPI00084EC007|nr:PREDICTED: hippocampus abundant transcript 1 protein-like isoform X6 [Trachymyrmex zeteki]XP_018340055.1 PREDICTED: hippocampus abundant transcript 1 protein-like isoform X6 [Trachymyrmex septentrionalis]XP_018367258.1 PREDICTED: hippocampus abundant transcript 1 protein isoform X6 [Trachymyrmex cornetzi]
MPPGASSGTEGLGPTCSEIHNNQDHATAKLTPPPTFVQQCYRHLKSSGVGEASVYHALVVIFLEFFAWGLLTMPIIRVLNETFPDHTFLMNGLIIGIKGILSFLSAPLIGALSDVWGRKFFLLITVAFTCAPIPLMSINTWWFFAMISISGVFACTFSVVFAYVADVTEENQRSLAYGLVSATFAASMVISPALGAYIMKTYGENLAVALATAIAVLDVFFILVAVPESLPEKTRPPAPISWEQADPFAALGKVGKDHTILMLCVTVFLSYLPEAGVLASVSSITYPAISAFVSMHSDADKQGLVQGMVTGMRGLCNGLGPAMFGVIFYLFHVDLNDDTPNLPLKPSFVDENNRTGTSTHLDIMPQVHTLYLQLVPGPPFVFGALLVICALLVAAFIPESNTMSTGSLHHPSTSRRPSGKYAYQKCLSLDVQYEADRVGSGRGKIGPLSPLVDNCNSAAL